MLYLVQAAVSIETSLPKKKVNYSLWYNIQHMVLWNFDLLWKNHGTMEKLWQYGQNFGTMEKTIVLYQRLWNFDL